MNMTTRQKMKYLATTGSPSLESGVVSATRSMNTVTANIKVTDKPIRSPVVKNELFTNVEIWKYLCCSILCICMIFVPGFISRIIDWMIGYQY